MGCSSQKVVQTDEANENKEEANEEKNEELQISLKEELKEENQEPKIEDININDNPIEDPSNNNQDENIKENSIDPVENIENENQDKKSEEIPIQQVEDNSDKKEEEEEIPEDINIEEDEYNKILFSGDNASDKKDNYNLRANDKSNLVQIKKKTLNKKKKKKPFIITVEEYSSYKVIKILFNACSFLEESMMPIWCPKGSYIKFYVKGKWRIDRLYPLTDSRGLPTNNKGGLGYGALMGRIGNGEKFVVSDDKAVIVKEEGPLYMKQILPKYLKVNPEGSIEVKVYDGEYMEIEEINKRIGWTENNKINNDENNKEEKKDNEISKKEKEKKDKKDFENKIRNEYNNLRMNPLIFYEQYISKTRNMNQTKKYLEKINNFELQALNPIDEYYEAILDYFKLFGQEMNIRNINNIYDYLIEIEGDIGYYLSERFEGNVKVKCKLTQKTNPKDIIIQCFYDKNYRFYIFNKRNTDLTVVAYNNYYKNFTLIIMASTFESKYKEANQE